MAGSSSTGLVIITVRNCSPQNATLLWCDGDREVEYASVPAKSIKTQETFDGHVWRLRNECTTVELQVSSSATATTELVLAAPEGIAPSAAAEGSALSAEPEGSAPSAEPMTDAASFYTQHVEVGCAGLQVRASDAVAAGALLTAADIAREMLRCSPASLLERLAARQCSVSIIGKEQVTSDIPEHREWALSASRPAEPSAPAAAAAAMARDEGDSAGAAQRNSIAKALQPRIEKLDALQLSEIVLGLVERGLLSDATLRDALDRQERASDDVQAMQVEAPPPPPSSSAPAAADALVAKAPAADETPAAGSKKRELSEIDRTTRGVGGGVVTSVGEENLLDVDTDPGYREESVLCHEFGHTVMNLGMSDEARGLVSAAHADALRRRLYPSSCYMGSNADEYWAEGTQAWFDATVRTDVNNGVNSRARLCAHDPALALLLRHAYGDGPWRFTDCIKDATRDKWRKLQVGGTKASTGEGGTASLPQPAADGRSAAEHGAVPTSEEEEERMMALAIAQSLEAS